MNTTGLKHPLVCHGPDHRLVYIKFTPDSTNPPIVDESHGFSSTVGYTSAGIYTATISNMHTKDITVVSLHAVLGDTNYHTYEYSVNETTRVVTVTHKTVAYSTGLVAPSVSNTSGMITLICLVRIAS